MIVGTPAAEVVDYIIRLKREYKKVVCLLGNHEYMLIRYLEGVDEGMYLENGGIATLHSYGISRSDEPKKEKLKFRGSIGDIFESLLPYYETEDYIFVHAGLKPGLPLHEQTMYDLLWVRHEFIDAEDDFGKMVIFGHTPLSYPLIMPNKIGIDTGAVLGAISLVLNCPTVKIHQV
ncbi:MAG: metallophosphoesterase [Desulfomicrobium escambiense]|nr:metallophosphoesterase [Desulfomicrobium escambiense]